MFFLVLGAFLWILFALWPAWVAKNKGYSWLGFFLLSLVLFVITLLIVYMLPNKLESREDVADDRAAEKALESEENAV